MLNPPETTRCEIGQLSWSPVLSGNCVIDFERRLVEFLRHTAVLAAIAGAQPDLTSKRRIHGGLTTSCVSSDSPSARVVPGT